MEDQAAEDVLVISRNPLYESADAINGNVKVKHGTSDRQSNPVGDHCETTEAVRRIQSDNNAGERNSNTSLRQSRVISSIDHSFDFLSNMNDAPEKSAEVDDKMTDEHDYVNVNSSVVVDDDYVNLASSDRVDDTGAVVLRPKSSIALEQDSDEEPIFEPDNGRRTSAYVFVGIEQKPVSVDTEEILDEDDGYEAVGRESNQMSRETGLYEAVSNNNDYSAVKQSTSSQQQENKCNTPPKDARVNQSDNTADVVEANNYEETENKDVPLYSTPNKRKTVSFSTEPSEEQDITAPGSVKDGTSLYDAVDIGETRSSRFFSSTSNTDYDEVDIGPTRSSRSPLSVSSVNDDTCEDSETSSICSNMSRKLSVETKWSIGRKRGDVKSVYKRQSVKDLQDERKVILEKQGEDDRFGFQLIGDYPTTICSVDSGSLAEAQQLKEGDVVLNVNGIDVQACTLNQVVEFMKRDSSRLELHVARLSSNLSRELNKPLVSGFMSKVQGRAHKRRERYWCTLYSGGVLYYHRKQQDPEPVGAVHLPGYSVSRSSESGTSYGFRLSRYGSSTHVFITDDSDDFSRWVGALREAVRVNQDQDPWFPVTTHNVDLAALDISRADMQGMLSKQSDSWSKKYHRRYCVLRDACLYMYKQMQDSRARRVVHFHGYTVTDTSLTGRKASFSLNPPTSDMRTYYFQADTEVDKEKWIECFRRSIGRWVKVKDDVFE